MSLRFRRGGAPDPPPPPSQIYGPVLGAQYIRDHAGPSPVTDPGGGVPFSPGSDIVTLITANPANTIFVASAPGTYPNFRNINYSNKHPRFFFPGDALVGTHTMTGAGSLNEQGISGGSAGIEIYGGKWTGYGTAASTSGAAIRSDSGPTIIQDAFVTGNGRSGIATVAPSVGTTFTITRCKLLSNGRYNLSAGSPTQVGRVILEDCWLERGNSNNNDPGGDAGCMKINNSDGSILRRNRSIGNIGFGIWLDGANRNALITDNVVENNTGIAPITGAGGLFYEIGTGGSVIEHNYLTGNGDPTNNNYPFNGVQLIVSNAPCDGTGDGVPNAIRGEVRFNDIDASGFRTPICIYNHSSHPDPRRARNWYVHHNRMFQRGTSGQSRVGLSDQCTVGSAKEGDIGTSPGTPGLCLFDYNEYHVANVNGNYWNHDTSSQSPGAINWTDFKARGHEVNGTLVAI